MEVTDDM